MSLHRTYPMPSMQLGRTNILEEDIEENEELSRILELGNGEEYNDELVKELKEWRSSIIDKGKTPTIPPYLLGRIMTRFNFTVKNIATYGNLGLSMQQAVILFLNACLVEEVKEKLDGVGVSNNNPIGSSTIFKNNIKKIKDSNSGEKLQLTRWLITCPLLYCFINKDLLKECEEAFVFKADANFLLYNILKKVELSNNRKDSIKIHGGNYRKSLATIKERGITLAQLKESFYDKNDVEAKEWIESLEFVNSINENGIDGLRAVLKEELKRNRLI